MCLGVGANLWRTHSIQSDAYEPYGARRPISCEEIGREDYYFILKRVAVGAVLVGLFAIFIGNLLYFEPMKGSETNV
jgi:hypothetical protein